MPLEIDFVNNEGSSQLYRRAGLPFAFTQSENLYHSVNLYLFRHVISMKSVKY